ncbi:uncharacterized protein BJ171DRAFT_584646 [Polychytrium aggregatum]|uniref:uncharacterized protein n=1 Tax=Polychytrium aggregatum TaxID=110093 RepID=UPI0022FE10BC|nr:uncharacterized protein BJ171DRAFT_584646 [Polychytrium aggregatum]KAI9202001.1 hypothetical protein BJ171DRAFT_584646 [Polychytrium aggregatum]
MTTAEDIQVRIKEAQDAMKALKQRKAPKEEIDAQIEVLKALQEQKKSLGEDGDQSKKFTLKVPKGTKDYTDKEMAVREKIFSTITQCFKRHGGITIDTPVFELKEILSGKYGEDSKLIYDLQDQGGELCSLRYDLTVPFARFLAMNSKEYPTIKRYQIAKVYRRDQPSVTKGRMREFYQCDFDIAGTFDPMIPDAEVVKVMVEILTQLDVGDFTVKMNHRKILDGMFEVCGVPAEKIRPISSAVDKLDKMSWEDVRKEMTQEKGLDPAVADRIGEYVKLKGGAELCEILANDPGLSSNSRASAGIKDMRQLFRFLDIFGISDRIIFDLSLARGLDYYTGVIYEAVFNASMNKDDESSGTGSIAAGGRYDELVGMFSGGQKIPCVGVSIGVERVFSILMRKLNIKQVKANQTQVYVIGVGDGQLEERMRICKELWDADIKADFMHKAKPKLQAQWTACDKDQIPLAIIIGESEVKEGIVKLKDMRAKDSEQGGGVTIKRVEMVAEIKRRLEDSPNEAFVSAKAAPAAPAPAAAAAAPKAKGKGAAPKSPLTGPASGVRSIVTQAAHHGPSGLEFVAAHERAYYGPSSPASASYPPSWGASAFGPVSTACKVDNSSKATEKQSGAQPAAAAVAPRSIKIETHTAAGSSQPQPPTPKDWVAAEERAYFGPVVGGW